MRITNGRVTLEVADNSGILTKIRDEAAGMDYIQSVPETAFRVIIMDQRPKTLTAFERFSMTKAEDTLKLSWTLPHGVTLNAAITLLDDGIAFTSSADAQPQTRINMVEYPVVGGMAAWNDATEMAHPFATGLLVKRPLECFKNGEGIRYAPYPESFSGSTMQYFSYYARELGGLAFMAEDGQSHQKWLNLYRNQDAMEATMMYGCEDMGEGKTVCAPYPFTVRFLSGKGWWEASDLYKAWAFKQSWCSQGPAANREHSQWLMKKVGLSTFGINAGQDRAKYISRYHQDVGTPIFHVLGPDWTNTPQTFGGGNPGGLADWVPTRFNKETLTAIREAGDYFAPFEFDTMALPDKADAEEVKRCRHDFPPAPYTYSCDQYHFHMLCPYTQYMHDMHVARDTQVTQEAGVDAMYYDISANNLLHICLDKSHGHPVGGGHVITQAYKKVYRDTKEACRRVKGQYFPLGTEMINEVFLPEIDYYQARAGAQPSSALELWPYKALIREGKAELIPMFAYVYHELGTVRMDGWGKLVEEAGDLYYDSVAKIYLWGGLYELNYEYSPSEAFDGVETRGEDHYYPFAPFGYEYSPGRARYLRQFAAMRTGIGNRYLAYGQMLPPPDIASVQKKKRYYHYNHGPDEIFEGEITLPAVRASAYRSCDREKTGHAIFLVNTDLDQQTLSLTLDPKDYCQARQLTVYTDFDPDYDPVKVQCKAFSENELITLTLSLKPRKAVMIEIN